jgi:hypothetical protein
MDKLADLKIYADFEAIKFQQKTDLDKVIADLGRYISGNDFFKEQKPRIVWDSYSGSLQEGRLIHREKIIKRVDPLEVKRGLEIKVVKSRTAGREK